MTMAVPRQEYMVGYKDPDNKLDKSAFTRIAIIAFERCSNEDCLVFTMHEPERGEGFWKATATGYELVSP